MAFSLCDRRSAAGTSGAGVDFHPAGVAAFPGATSGSLAGTFSTARSNVAACRAGFSDQAEQRVEHRKGFTALFGPEHLRDSLALWFAFFNVPPGGLQRFQLAPYHVDLGWAEWRSCFVRTHRIQPGERARRFGLRGCYHAAWCAGAAASALLLRQLRVQNHTTLLILGLGVHGLFVNAVQSTMFALCAYVYPTAIRATGAASALASGYLGAAVITAGESSGFLLLLGGAMFQVLIALASGAASHSGTRHTQTGQRAHACVRLAPKSPHEDRHAEAAQRWDRCWWIVWPERAGLCVPCVDSSGCDF
jgi:hypothetical protein